MLTFTGAMLAYLIGSGFATGQELMQYFLPFGKDAVFACALTALMLIIANLGFGRAGRQAGADQAEMFAYLCGARAGTLFYRLSGLFCLLSYIVMLSGAGSTLAQQYALPPVAGVAAMALLTATVVSLGLNSLVQVISRIGPLLAALLLTVGIFTLLGNFQQIPDNLLLLEEKNSLPLLPAAPVWWLSGALNGGMNLLIMAGLMARLGQEYQGRRLMAGSAAGALLYAAASLLMTAALLSVLPSVAGSAIPHLLLAKNVSLLLAALCGGGVFLAIFTTACPLLWTVASRGGGRFLPRVWGIAAAGCLAALLLPFPLLMNRVYALEGGAGILLLLFIIRRLLAESIAKRRQDKPGGR